MLNSKKSCESAIRDGWICALISMAMTLLVAILGLASVEIDGADELNLMIDPLLLVDVALIAVMAYLIRQKSRAGATAMFLYFLASKWYFWNQTDSYGGLGFGLVFLVFYARAMIATYVWRLRYASDRNIEDLEA